MVLFLYTDKNYEHQVKYCLESLQDKISDDIKIVYYTIGFESSLSFKNFKKIEVPIVPQYSHFNYYKADLSLLTLKLFPEEKYFIFSDSDILYSNRFNFENLKHDYPYPLASFGPHEYPFIFEAINDTQIIHNETKLMSYLNVPERSQRYVWSCFYSFNQNCLDFFEEFSSICNNEYLLSRKKQYLPFHDETAFNICLWKRKAVQNLGFSFVNTASPELVKKVEYNKITDQYSGKNLDFLGAEWEYVHDSENVLFYHGFKEEGSICKALEYLKGINVSDMVTIKNDQTGKEKKIAIVTLYDKKYEEFAKYSIPNKIQYANKHKYDLIYFNGSLDTTRPPQWSKIKAVQNIINEYDWVWWIDVDSLIMNHEVTLESIIDDDFDIILTSNSHSYISNGSSFFKNTDLTKEFLTEAYDLKLDFLKHIEVDIFDHEQQSMRDLLYHEEKFRNKTKLISERVCNSYCKTKNAQVLELYADWNVGDNIYQDGDFVVQFCGRTIDERLEDMFEYLLPKKISIVLLSNEEHILNKQIESIKNTRYKINLHLPKADNQKFYSFSQLINDSVNETECEFMIFVNPKTQVTSEDIDFIIKQLHTGYCYVSVVGFGLFGTTKQLFRDIGLMDERFLGGEYEDNDMAMRLKLFNKAIYVKLDYSKYDYEQAPSNYNSIRGCSLTMFYDKWNFVGDEVLIDREDFQSTKKISKRHKKENDIKHSWLDYDKSFIDDPYTVFSSTKNYSIKIVDLEEKKKVNNDIAIRIQYNKEDNGHCFIEFLSNLPTDILSCHVVNISDPFVHNCQYEQIFRANTWWHVNISTEYLYEMRLFYKGSIVYRNVLNKDINAELTMCVPVKVL